MRIKNPLAAIVFGVIIIGWLLLMAVPMMWIIIRSYLHP